MSDATVRVPAGSRLRPDAPLNYLKLAVAKALLAQMDKTSDWRDIAQLTGTDELLRAMDFEDQLYVDSVISRLDERGDFYDAAVREYVPHLLGVESVRIPGEELTATPRNLVTLEDRLSLPAWLEEHEPDLHRRLYAAMPRSSEDATQAPPQFSVDLNTALAIMDNTAANLERMQKVWDRALPKLPTSPSLGADTESEDLARAWEDLKRGLPKIEGWTITDPIPTEGEIGALYYEYLEVGQEPSSILFNMKEKPQRDLDEYRYRLARARRRVIRDRLQDLTAKVDFLLPQIIDGVPRDSTKELNSPHGLEIWEAVNEVERLIGDTAQRTGGWGALYRHLSFDQGVDWHDIYETDWPSVKKDIEAASFAETDPLPVPEGIDLGDLATSKPVGKASTKLNWDVLDAEGFERLLYDLVRQLPGYQNVKYLMRTNAADRGRDISAEHVYSDGASVRTDRVMIQAKHYLSRSVPPEEINSGLVRIKLWEPPPIRTYVVATSGAFTPDAVAWAEKHNNEVKVPFVNLWTESELSSLLSERPALAAEYGLR